MKTRTCGVAHVENVIDLAVDLMTNSAVTGATFDFDGGQQLVDC